MTRQSSTTVYVFSEFELDVGKHCLRRRGVEIHLRQKVFQVLLCLIEHRDRLVSKEELIECVWNGASVSDDVVFRCVIDIRGALQDDRHNPRFIRTLPKTGYRFIGSVEELRRGNARPVAAPATPATRRRLWLAAGLCAVAAASAYLLLRPRAMPELKELAWWRLDEGASKLAGDSSGYGYQGRFSGSAAWVEGRLGKALSFDGLQGWLEGSDRGLPAGSAPRSITAWVRMPGGQGDHTNILQYGTLGWPQNRHFHLFVRDSGQLGLGYGTDTAVRGRAALADGQWHFAAGVYEGGETNLGRIFVDGALDAWGPLPALPDTVAGGKWHIGGRTHDQTQFRGAIDDVRLYPRALRGCEVEALFRCSSAEADVALPGGPGYYFQIHGLSEDPIQLGAARPGEPSRPIVHAGKSFGGVQFARASGACAVPLRGADIGQDLYISMEVLVPGSPPEPATAAGPYFRSRKAAPGDGLIGGTSAGYWVELQSDGAVKIRRLNPHEVVAFAGARPGFDPSRFHRLEMAAQGNNLQVALDGVPVEFDQNGVRTGTVSIQPAWQGPPAVGFNEGAAGIWFSSTPRGAAGGQEVRRLVVEPYRKVGRERT